jgi:hypothetical protein
MNARGERFATCLTAVVLVAVLSGCTGGGAPEQKIETVAPAPIVSTQASFDGNAQNSGYLGYNEHGFLVTPGYLQRYDALLETYGSRLTPKRAPGDREGISEEPPNYRITGEVRMRFWRMNQWRKAEQGKVQPETYRRRRNIGGGDTIT